MDNVDIFVHTAAPFVIDQKDDPGYLEKKTAQYYISALEVVEAMKVPKVVLLSSLTAVLGMDAMSATNPEKLFDEEYVLGEPELEAIKNESTGHRYINAKVEAEKAIWEHVESLRNRDKLTYEVVTLCPGFIFGPNLNKNWFQVGDFISGMIENPPTDDEGTAYTIVDVRDVAKLHLEATKRKVANN